MLLTIFPWQFYCTSIVPRRPFDIPHLLKLHLCACACPMWNPSQNLLIRKAWCSFHYQQDYNSSRLHLACGKSSYPWSWSADPSLVVQWEGNALLWSCRRRKTKVLLQFPLNFWVASVPLIRSNKHNINTFRYLGRGGRGKKKRLNRLAGFLDQVKLNYCS